MSGHEGTGADGRPRRIVAALLALAVVAGIVTGISFALRSGPPPAPGARSVTGVTTVPYRPVKVSGQTGRPFSATGTRWPQPTSAMVTLAAPAGTGQAGPVAHAPGTPAWAQAAAPARGSWHGPARLGVRVEPRALAGQLGVSGVVWQVSGLTAGTGSIRAGLDYSSFSQAYGGNYGQRLTVEQLPACALTTPQLARCRTQTPLRTVNDYKSKSVSALIGSPASQPALTAYVSSSPAQPAVAASGSVVLAATTTAGGDGGPAGTYGATSLKPSGTWTQGGASGSFTYTYPIAVPSASSMLVPQVGLNYDSGSVDGQDAATQAQANWAGDGWSTGDSFIDQTFTPCKDDPASLPSADQTEDMCYAGNVLTVSLDGRTTALVRDDATGAWRLQADDGATVRLVTNSGNGTSSYNTSYWVITERDGTAYYFGLNHLPGWSSGDTATNSVDTEPVFSPEPGDPCYNSAGFSSSVCTMAYRWHLDYVTDTHGDATASYYAQDTNYYGENQGAQDVSYIRDSHLTEIDYGFRDGGAYGTIPDKVIFGTSSRCVASSCPAITSSNSGAAGSDYPDVPYDLNCGSGTTCTTWGPTFWSTVRLTSITTEQYSASASAFKNVDSYALTQTEPSTGDGTSPTLWLASITRTGDDTSAGGSSSAILLPAVTFTGTDLQNRVDTTNFPGLYRYRLTSITNEMGGVTGITYGTPGACTASYVESITTNSAATSNTNSCYPIWWQPAGYSAPVMDWFEKYAVTQVLESDATGGALAKQTDYSYSGGAAWHFDDNEVVMAKYRTYGQWRGYGTVTTLTGDGVNNPQTKSVTSYYRGMSDDNNSTAVRLADSQGGTHDDANQLAGLLLETTVYNGSGGPVDHSTIDSYWVSAAAVTRTRSGLPALTANMTGTAEEWTRQALTDGGTATWRYTETDTTYDTSTSSADFGMATYQYTHTVPTSTAYDRCTATTYAPANTPENLTGLPASRETDSVACSGFTEGSPSSAPTGLNTLTAPSSVSRPGQVVSATQTFYDDTSFSTAFPQTTPPTTGNVTMTRKAVTYSSGAFTWQTTARDTYDQYGRVQDAYDGNGNHTITSYTVDSAGLTTGQKVTNPLGQAAAQTLDPTRGLALTSTDANGVVTTSQYDALGRVTSVWLDSRATTAEANNSYAYTVSGTGVSGIVAKTMGDAGGYATTVTIVDSLGRTRQTQADTPQGGRLVTEELYDSRGWVQKKNDRYWDSSTPPALSVVSVADSQVPAQDEYTYNGLGQVVQDASRQYASTISTTTTVYNGDRTTVIPPTGGVIKSTLTDPMGRTSEIDQYTSAPALAAPSNTFTGTWYLIGGTATAAKYGYDGHGNQATITDANGSTWTSAYDLLGQVTSKTDPDAGTFTMSYDGNGNPIQSTDARGDTVSYSYDALNRKTAEYAAQVSGQSSANELASWVYDNADNAVSGMKYPVGHVTTATSYSGGAVYVTQAKGFNVFGESLGETVTVPSAAGALAGSYTFGHTYTTGVGLPYSDTYPSAGGLPAETVIHSYLASPLALPSGLGGSIDGYAQTTSYDAYGDVLQEEIGTGSNLASITNTYDPHTLQLSDQLVTRSAVSPKTVDDQKYSYDLSGNITAQASTRLGSPATSETQCYQYDGLDRLTTAWTATDSCATTPTSTNSSMVGDGLGTSSAYWTTWNYSATGQITSQDQRALSGGSDTVTTDTYSSSQPHALTQAAATGGSSSTSTFGWDAAGNMTSRGTSATGNQTLNWNAAGQLTSVTSGAGSTSYIYDPGGNLLLQQDPGTTTLYLPGEQLTAAGSTVSGARIIALPSGGDVVRTGTTTSYVFEIPGQQGTSTLYLDNTAQTPAWRQFTPYGGPRGQAVTWPDNRGFLNKPADPATGLTILGARQYDPATGQFISPDPLLAPGDPQDLNPYAYSQDNPVTNSDPSGLCPQENECGGVPQPGDPGHRHIQPAPNPACGTPGAPACWTPPSSAGSGGGCGFLGLGCAWHAASWLGGQGSDLLGGIGNGITDFLTSAPRVLLSLIDQMADAFPTGITPGGQLQFSTHTATPPASPWHIGNRDSILYKAGYYGSPLLVAPEAAPEEAATGGSGRLSQVLAPKITAYARTGGARSAASIAAGADVSTAPDSAFLWTGLPEPDATTIAEANGGVTLEGTLRARGVNMPNWDSNNPDVSEGWMMVSARYAAAASGRVRVIVGAGGIRSDSVFNLIELPTLLANPDVTGIDYIYAKP